MDAETELLLREVEKAVAKLRAHVAAEAGEVTQDLKDQRWFWILRAVQAEGGRVLRSRWSELGRANGYHPSSLGGFFVGDGTMKTEGDWRVLTPVGVDWIERGKHLYGDGPSPFAA